MIARKLLEIHQVFLRRFHTINRKICLHNLHTRFNQHFPNPRGRAYSCLRQLYASGGLPPDRPCSAKSAICPKTRRCSFAGYGKEIESRGVGEHFYPKVMLAFSTLFLRRTLRLSPCTSLSHAAKRRASEGTADPRGRAYSCLRQLYASGGLPPDRPFRLRRNGRARAVRSLQFVPNAA